MILLASTASSRQSKFKSLWQMTPIERCRGLVSVSVVSKDDISTLPYHGMLIAQRHNLAEAEDVGEDRISATAGGYRGPMSYQPTFA